MNNLLVFISPLEILVVIIFLIGFPVLIVLIVVFSRRSSRRKAKESMYQDVIKEQNQPEVIFSEKNSKEYYPVKEGNKVTLISFGEIVDLSVANGFVFLTDLEGKEYVVDSTLTELDKKFPKEFIRIHKSAIVNKNLILEVKKLDNGRYDLVMKCKKERIISCSKSYNEKIKTLIDF